MAGSYRHITDHNNQFKGLRLLENLGDAREAREELVDMIHYLTGDSRDAVDAYFPIYPDTTMTWAYQQIKMMFNLIQDITGGDRQLIWMAWCYGHLQRVCPSNISDHKISGFNAFWGRDGEEEPEAERQPAPAPQGEQTQLLRQIAETLEIIKNVVIDIETAGR